MILKVLLFGNTFPRQILGQENWGRGEEHLEPRRDNRRGDVN